jgi:hypothetical protein
MGWFCLFSPARGSLASWVVGYVGNMGQITCISFPGSIVTSISTSVRTKRLPNDAPFVALSDRIQVYIRVRFVRWDIRVRGRACMDCCREQGRMGVGGQGNRCSVILEVKQSVSE